MTNYTKTNIGNEGRTELHERLALTGAEVSVNRLPAGVGVHFVHAHKMAIRRWYVTMTPAYRRKE